MCEIAHSPGCPVIIKQNVFLLTDKNVLFSEKKLEIFCPLIDHLLVNYFGVVRVEAFIILKRYKI